MVAVMLGTDLAFFRNKFGKRLAANIATVLVFAGFLTIATSRGKTPQWPLPEDALWIVMWGEEPHAVK